MLQLIQYIKGYVCIRVWGYSPERLMNLCSNHDIFLWNIENHGEYYTMCISAAGFKLLKPIVRKTGTKVAILNRCGLPFFVPQLKKRKMFLFGLLGSLLFWIWMSGYIWAVDISGNYSITSDVFMDFLSENQIYVGMKHSQVDIEALEKKIRQDFDIVTWTSAKIEGTRLEIQVKENDIDSRVQSGEGVDEKETQNEFGSDLTAENTGTVVTMVTRSGVPMVTIGAQVKEGDLLVSGMIPVYNEDGTVRKYRYCEADADIYISREIVQGEQIPLKGEKKAYTGGSKEQRFITLFNKDIMLGWGKLGFEHYDKVTNRKQVKLLENFYLPIYYGSIENREYQVENFTYTEEEVKNIFSEKLSKFVQTLEEKGVQIIRKDVKIKKGSKWIMKAEFTIVEKIGKNTPIVPDAEEMLPEQTADVPLTATQD